MSVFSANGAPHGVAQTGDLSRMVFSCSYPTCSQSFENFVARNAHEMNNHGAVLSTLNVHSSKSSKEISPADVIAYMRQSGAGEDSIRGAYASPALLDYHFQLMLLEQQNKQRLAMKAPAQLPSHLSGTSPTSPDDYNTQLRLLEQQNRKRLAMARGEQADDERAKSGLRHTSSEHRVRCGPLHEPKSAYETQQKQLKLLEEQNKKRLAMARAEQDTSFKSSFAPSFPEWETKCDASPESKPADEMQQKQQKQQEGSSNATPPVLLALNMPTGPGTHLRSPETSVPAFEDPDSNTYTGPSHQLWLSGPHALQDYETQRQFIEQQKHPRNQPSGNIALQDYQMQLMLLEQQNKKRRDAALANLDAEQARKHRKSDGEPPLPERILSKHQKDFVEKGKHLIQRHIQRAQDNTGQAPPGHTVNGVNPAFSPYAESGPVSAPSVTSRGSDDSPFDSSGFSKRYTGTTMPGQMTAQQQAMIRRHQENMDGWKKMRQQKTSMEKASQEGKLNTTLEPSKWVFAHSSPDTTNGNKKAAPLSGVPPHLQFNGYMPPTTSHHGFKESPDRPRRAGRSANCSDPEEHFVMDLPVRVSKPVAKQKDPELDEWAEVERPQERACSEESEEFN